MLTFNLLDVPKNFALGMAVAAWRSKKLVFIE